jgi:hypothetical protein
MSPAQILPQQPQPMGGIPGQVMVGGQPGPETIQYAPYDPTLDGGLGIGTSPSGGPTVVYGDDVPYMMSNLPQAAPGKVITVGNPRAPSGQALIQSSTTTKPTSNTYKMLRPLEVVVLL